MVFLRIQDFVKKCLHTSGAVMMEDVINSECGDTVFLMACVDGLVELGEFREVPVPGTIEQHRVFISLTAHT